MAFDVTNTLESTECNNGDIDWYDGDGSGPRQNLVSHSGTTGGFWYVNNGSTPSSGTGPDATGNPPGNSSFCYAEMSGSPSAFDFVALWTTQYSNLTQDLFVEVDHYLYAQSGAALTIEYSTLASPDPTDDADWTVIATATADGSDPGQWDTLQADLSGIASSSTVSIRLKYVPPGNNFANDGAIANWRIYSIDSATFEQEGFRVRADDDDEANATWLHAQDVSPIQAAACAGVGGTGIWVPRSAGNVITGDIFIAAQIRPSVSDETFMVLSRFESSGDYCFYFGIRSDGAVIFGWSADGTNVSDVASTVAWYYTGHSIPIATSQMFWLGVAHDVDNGASGRDTSFFAAPSKELLLANQLGSTQTFGTNGTIFDSSTAEYWIGAREDGGFHFDGGIYEVEAYSGLDFDGTRKLSPYFWDDRQGWEYGDSEGDTGTDEEGNVWTIGSDQSILSGPPFAGTPLRLRGLLNATGDPASAQAGWEYIREDEYRAGYDEWRLI